MYKLNIKLITFDFKIYENNCLSQIICHSDYLNIMPMLHLQRGATRKSISSNNGPVSITVIYFIFIFEQNSSYLPYFLG